MKKRFNFVSNSSSSSFIINNKSTEKKSVADFALENIFLIKQFNSEYSGDVSLDAATQSAEIDYDHISLNPGENECSFGDEEGTVLGRVYDYILRDGGESKNFSWRYHDSLR